MKRPQNRCRYICFTSLDTTLCITTKNYSNNFSFVRSREEQSNNESFHFGTLEKFLFGKIWKLFILENLGDMPCGSLMFYVERLSLIKLVVPNLRHHSQLIHLRMVQLLSFLVPFYHYNLGLRSQLYSFSLTKGF